MTPEENAARWKAFEQHYGPIPQPPDAEAIEDERALVRYCALFEYVPFDSWRAAGMGRG